MSYNTETLNMDKDMINIEEGTTVTGKELNPTVWSLGDRTLDDPWVFCFIGPYDSNVYFIHMYRRTLLYIPSGHCFLYEVT